MIRRGVNAATNFRFYHPVVYSSQFESCARKADFVRRATKRESAKLMGCESESGSSYEVSKTWCVRELAYVYKERKFLGHVGRDSSEGASRVA